MYIDTCSIAASQSYNESMNPAQFSIDLLRADCAMFESLINLDIAQALNESGQIVLSEADMETMLEGAGSGIIAKIKELIGKIKSAISGFVKKISSKLQEIFDKDKKIYKKYSEAFKNVVNNPSIAKDYKVDNFEIPNYDNLDKIFAGDIVTNIFKNIELLSTISKLKMIRDESECSKILKDFNKKCDEELEEVDKISQSITEKKSGFVIIDIIKADNLSRIEENIKFGKNKRIKLIEKMAAIQQAELKKIESETNIQQLKGTAYDGYLDRQAEEQLPNDKNPLSGSITKYNTMYSIISKAQQIVNKIMSYQLSAVKKEYALERKIFLQIGKLNKNNEAYKPPEEDETKNESALDLKLWAIGEASDLYIEESFASLF